MLKRTKREWIELVKTKMGREASAKPQATQQPRYNVLQDDMEKSKRLRCNRECFGSHFADHSRAKRIFYLSKFLSLPSKLGTGH